jgi:exodeoxyribonuclease V alpha subunit
MGYYGRKYARRSFPKAVKVESFLGNAEVRVMNVRFAKGAWFILACETEDGEPLTCVGVFHAPPYAGGRVYVRGEWENDSTYGWQFRVHAGFPLEMDKADLETPSGMEIWLTRLPEVGPVRAKHIIELFGDKCIHVLETEPARFLEVPGITEARLSAMQDALAREQLDPELLRWLIDLGLDSKIIEQAIERYGPDFADVVETRPYELIRLAAATWAQIDMCGREQGFADDDPNRIGMTLWWVTRAACQKGGHTCADLVTVRNQAMQLLQIKDFDPIFREMQTCRWVVTMDDSVSTLDMFEAEQTIASEILRRPRNGHE